MRDKVRVRTLIVSDLVRAMMGLRTRLGYPDPDPEVLVHFEGDKVFDLAEDLARTLMARLEGTAPPQDISRFDKIRREVSKHAKPLKGQRSAGEPTDSDALPEAPNAA